MQYCTSMRADPPDLVTSSEARIILGGKRLEPYYREGRTARIAPVMRVGSGPRSPLLFNRADVEKLRDEILANLNKQVDKVNESVADSQS